MYAHTHVQLNDQLHRQAYTEADQRLVARAYALAVRLFTGRFLPSGTPFLHHVVRTASIVARQGAAGETVAAALLHSVYAQGDFGDGVRWFSPSKEARVVEALGGSAAALVGRYRRMKWNVETIPALRERVASLDELDREALLIRLANDLEHNIDGEILYFAESESQRVRLLGPEMAEMAVALGHQELASDLKRAHERALSARVPAPIATLSAEGDSLGVFRVGASGSDSKLILPASAIPCPPSKDLPSRSLWRRIARGVRKRLRTAGRRAASRMRLRGRTG